MKIINKVVEKLNDPNFTLSLLVLVLAGGLAGASLLTILKGLLTENGNRLVYTDTVLGLLGICIYLVSFARGYKNLTNQKGLPPDFVAKFSRLDWSVIFIGIAIILMLLSIVQVTLLMTIEPLSLFQQQLWLGITLVVILLLRAGGFWLGSSYMEFKRKTALAASWWIPLASILGMWRSMVYDADAVFSTGMMVGLGVGGVLGLMVTVIIEVPMNQELAKSKPISCVAQIFSTLFGLLMMLLVPLIICFSPSRWGPHTAEDARLPPSVNAGLALFVCIVSFCIVTLLWRHRPHPPTLAIDTT